MVTLNVRKFKKSKLSIRYCMPIKSINVPKIKSISDNISGLNFVFPKREDGHLEFPWEKVQCEAEMERADFYIWGGATGLSDYPENALDLVEML